MARITCFLLTVVLLICYDARAQRNGNTDAVKTMYKDYRALNSVGRLEWAAELRWLDGHDSSYRN